MSTHHGCGSPLRWSLPCLLVAAGLAAIARAAEPAAPGPGLEQGFRAVPDADKPWVYWWWLKGNVSEASITRDLEAMKQNGIGGLLMFDARGYHEGHVQPPPSRMEFMSPEWRRMLKVSLAEAGRLGLKVSVNLSSCAGALKGPWEVGGDAPKKLVWTATSVRGPQRLDCPMPKPAGPNFHDIALLAVRHADVPGGTSAVAETPTTAVAISDTWIEDVAGTGACVAASGDAIDLSEKTDAEGRLTWDAPEGSWTLLRFGTFTMPGHEFDVDVLDPKAVAGHFERMGGAILKDAGALAGTALTHFYSVSWEGAAPTWTPALEKEFATYRGYALRPWLPALAGFAVRSPEASAQFRRDYFKTLGDCFMNNFYGTLCDLTRKAGLQWHSESGGPWDRKLAAFEHADQLAFLGRNDMPQGEFWFQGHGKIGRPHDMNRPAAMAAHIHGLRLAATEAFTHMVQHWSAYPAVLKPGADSAFCDGINHFVWHTFTASPPEFGLPGVDYFAGTHLNPNVTWWPQAGPFLAYLGRCQWMLRQGGFVADVAAYTGDRPYQHWGRGTNWSPRATLATGPGRGYDLLTTEALTARATARDGSLALTAPAGGAGPAGREIMRYRALVVDLDDAEIPVEALRKIETLAKAGVPVIFGARRPDRSPGLSGQPAADAEVRRLAAALWTNTPAEPAKGAAPSTAPVEAALRGLGLPPDFEGPFDFTHRRADDTDIYFVAGSGAGDCTFRVKDREPELWDPVTGAIRDAVQWRATADGRTVVPLSLPGTGSVFVVFRRPAEAARLASVVAPAGAVEIAGRTKAGVRVRVWTNGSFAVETAQAKRIDLAGADLPAAVEIPGPWTVAFQPDRGAPESAVFETLADWTAHTNPGIRHFAGKGVYRATFDIGDARAALPARLRLGAVHVIAQVRINGRDMGVVWTAPWTVDVTGALKAGRNEMEIDVVSLWMNRLIGDAALPPEKRIVKTNVTLEKGKRTVKVYQGFGSEDPLHPAGLLGPVLVEFARETVIPL